MGTHYRGTPPETRALDTFIKLMRASDSIEAALNRHLREIGLTQGQLAILEALLHLGPMSQQQLGAKILRSGSNVTMVIDNLEKQALVGRTRRADDRRVVEVSLTAKGRRYIEERFPLHARRITQLLAALEPKEQAELAALCKKLGRGVGPADAGPSRGRRTRAG
jgi:MarR family 2-MHQ and catechol resistance regulon transcriptional repressor